ncbi:MAG: cytidylate kinase family protein [bacterium]
MNIITVSRGSLTFSQMFSERLSSELGIPLIRREQVFEEADKYSIRETGFSDISFIDRAPSVWERQYYRRKHYLLAFQTALIDLALQGSCIYEGHLGQYLLTDIPFVLRTRIIQSEEKRIKSHMNLKKLSFDQARIYIKLVDERRRHWSEFLYGINIEDPRYYDFVVNLENMGIDSAVKVVSSAVQLPIYNSTPGSMSKLKDLNLVAKAKLYLYLSPKTRGYEVDITADSSKERIVVSGLSSTMDADKSEILISSVLSSLKGVKTIDYEN